MESCEYGNELSGNVKYWKFLGWLSNCWLLKNDLNLRSHRVGWLVCRNLDRPMLLGLLNFLTLSIVKYCNEH
jgi:hypothetical protein